MIFYHIVFFCQFISDVLEQAELRQKKVKQYSEETRNKLIDEYKEKFSSPFLAASRGYIDDVIDPAETRNKIASSLEIFSKKFLDNPSKKHGNIPL